MVLGLYPFADVAADGAPRLDADAGEELVRVERAAALALGPRAPEPPGTLFLTTKRVIWVSEGGKGYAVDFIAVSLHAVSRDPEAYPSPCIYTQIDTEAGSDEESDESDSEMNGEIDLLKVTEMRIVPSDPDQLDGLFEAFSHCAELNPDPNAVVHMHHRRKVLEKQSANFGQFKRLAMVKFTCVHYRILLALPLFENVLFFTCFSNLSESDEENGWVHGNEGEEDMTDGSDAEFSDVNPIGQTDDCDITHAVVELQINDQRFQDAEEADKERNGNGH
ncbi:unnamed protein product [Urochloa decumbens]|uniref:Chloride conductance regulatory protein ICln n=1 Tax=Urochloa decumbens TaxID=240449 RepID=A0ABC8XF15_9POAL